MFGVVFPHSDISEPVVGCLCKCRRAQAHALILERKRAMERDREREIKRWNSGGGLAGKSTDVLFSLAAAPLGRD